MRHELFQSPGYRATALPELCEFFKASAGMTPMEMTERFLETFSGAKIAVPSPDQLSKLKRDDQIITILELDSSVESLVEIMDKHDVTFQHLDDIYVACFGERIRKPDVGAARDVAVERASMIIKPKPHLGASVCAIFCLDSNERLQAANLAGRPSRTVAAKTKAKKKPAKKKTNGGESKLTATQSHLIEAVSNKYNPRRMLSIAEIAQCSDTPSRSVSLMVNTLVVNGYMQKSKKGDRFKFTKKARESS